MSCPAGRFSSSIFAVKSLSGSAAIGGSARALLKDSGGGDLDQHLRRTVGARPYHAAIDGDVAGLHAVGNGRPVGRAAEIRHRDGAEGAGAGARKFGEERRGGRGMSCGNPDRHASLLRGSGRGMPCRRCPTDLERIDDGSITETCRSGVAGRTELRARSLQVLRHAHQQRLAVGDRIVELVEHDVEGGQRAFLDRAVLEALQRIAQDFVGLGLHLVELFRRLASGAAAAIMSSRRSRCEVLTLRSSFLR